MGHAPLPADRDGKVEDGEHVGPFALDVEVGNDGGSDGGVAGLAHADQAAGQEEEPEVLEGGTGRQDNQSKQPWDAWRDGQTDKQRNRWTNNGKTRR